MDISSEYGGLFGLISSEATITGYVTPPAALYARWNLVTYSISYELDGGTNYQDAPTSYTVVTETIVLGTPTKNGYTFVGWYDAAAGGNKFTQITKGSTGDITLYARWTANTDTPYTVKHYQQNIEDNGYTLNPSSFISSEFTNASITLTGLSVAM
ncbi:MAG: InlB B-repeat-containing protein [Syntrophomonadaceae bacterium]|nr:InlB B-repeat-containing protein [Syntrophomonadaceae bacterium]